MEEGSGARRVTQRMLPEADAPRPGGTASETPGGGAAPAPSSPPPESLGEPSDLALRERQRVWWRERARFEASRSRDEAGEPASK